MKVQLFSGEYLEDLDRGLRIIQNKNLYCFSEDTLLLADFVQMGTARNIVDLGTGSGILLFLLYAKKPDITGVGIEIQNSLADLAKRSVIYNNLQDKIRIIEEDLKNAADILSRNSWDLVISNPPYIPAGRGRTSPKKEIAIARQELCCTLEDIVRIAALLLKPHGNFALVHRSERLPEIMYLLKKYKLEPKKMQLVAAEKKNPYLVLLQSQKSFSPGLEVLPQKNI